VECVFGDKVWEETKCCGKILPCLISLDKFSYAARAYVKHTIGSGSNKLYGGILIREITDGGRVNLCHFLLPLYPPYKSALDRSLHLY